MKPTLSDIEALARAAGEILRAGFGQRHQIRYKGAIDLVTEYDHLSEDLILKEIKSRWPEHRVVTEESGILAGQDCCQWYLDPIDGTVNFAHGVPIFCVSLAYVEDGVIQLGVVYDPMLNECFSAERGRGATLNGQPIQVSQPANLDRSLLVTGFGYDIRTNPINNLAQFAYFSLHSQGVRRLGSAALDLCYIGTGRFDGYWELEIKPWDIAAGGLIAQEAGAIVTNIQGSPDYLIAPCSILAAGRNIHPVMLEALRDS
jgi:myo-inositol-1(or 4)-monophosphatase